MFDIQILTLFELREGVRNQQSEIQNLRRRTSRKSLNVYICPEGGALHLSQLLLT